jgi:hypothetical protein
MPSASGGTVQGTFNLQPRHNLSKALTVFADSLEDGAPIVQWDFDEGASN